MSIVYFQFPRGKVLIKETWYETSIPTRSLRLVVSPTNARFQRRFLHGAIEWWLMYQHVLVMRPSLRTRLNKNAKYCIFWRKWGTCHTNFRFTIFGTSFRRYFSKYGNGRTHLQQLTNQITGLQSTIVKPEVDVPDTYLGVSYHVSLYRPFTLNRL